MTALYSRVHGAADLAATCVRRARLRRPGIGYIGWLGHNNLGDDAMFEAANDLLPGRSLEIFTGARREALLASGGLSGKRVFKHIFLGGGTLINEGYLPIVKRAIDLGVTISALGTGVGSSGFADNSKSLHPEWRDTLMRFERIGVRGPRSLETLRAVGVEKVEIVGDLALAMTTDDPIFDPKADGFLINFAAPKATDSYFPTKQVISEFVDAMMRLKKIGLRPIPVALSLDDLDPIRTVLDLSGVAEFIHRPKTAKAFFALASRARLSLGVRLHSAVLSTCVGIPSLSVAYRGKARDFAATVGLDEWIVDPDDGNLAERAEILVDVAQQVGATAHAAALSWRRKLVAYVDGCSIH